MIKFITYKAEQLPVRVGYFALKMIKEKTGKSITNLKELDDDSFTIYETLIFYALMSGYRAIEKPFPFKEEDMENVLDECFFEFVKIIPEFFPKNIIAGEGHTGKKLKIT